MPCEAAVVEGYGEVVNAVQQKAIDLLLSTEVLSKDQNRTMV